MSRTVRKGALFCIIVQGSAKFPEGKKSCDVLSIAFMRESKSSGCSSKNGCAVSKHSLVPCPLALTPLKTRTWNQPQVGKLFQEQLELLSQNIQVGQDLELKPSTTQMTYFVLTPEAKDWPSKVRILLSDGMA